MVAKQVETDKVKQMIIKGFRWVPGVSNVLPIDSSNILPVDSPGRLFSSPPTPTRLSHCCTRVHTKTFYTHLVYLDITQIIMNNSNNKCLLSRNSVASIILLLQHHHPTEEGDQLLLPGLPISVYPRSIKTKETHQ